MEYDKAVLALLTAKADVEKRLYSDEPMFGFHNGDTALILASSLGHTQIVKALLSVNTEIDATNGDGDTALIYASRKEYLEVVQELLIAKANPNIRNNLGYSALMITCQQGFVAIAETLIKYKADVNAVDTKGYTALMNASNNGHVDVVKLLLRENANVSVRTNDDISALYLAGTKGYTNVFQLLLEADPDVVNEAYWVKEFHTIRKSALDNGHNDFVNMLDRYRPDNQAIVNELDRLYQQYERTDKEAKESDPPNKVTVDELQHAEETKSIEDIKNLEPEVVDRHCRPGLNSIGKEFTKLFEQEASRKAMEVKERDRDSARFSEMMRENAIMKAYIAQRMANTEAIIASMNADMVIVKTQQLRVNQRLDMVENRLDEIEKKQAIMWMDFVDRAIHNETCPRFINLIPTKSKLKDILSHKFQLQFYCEHSWQPVNAFTIKGKRDWVIKISPIVKIGLQFGYSVLNAVAPGGSAVVDALVDTMTSCLDEHYPTLKNSKFYEEWVKVDGKQKVMDHDMVDKLSMDSVSKEVVGTAYEALAKEAEKYPEWKEKFCQVQVKARNDSNKKIIRWVLKKYEHHDDYEPLS